MIVNSCAIIGSMNNYVTKKEPLRIAVLDMNDGYKNLGIGCINSILAETLETWSCQYDRQLPAKIEQFRVRDMGEVPKHRFDIYISSGGPGSPHDGEGKQWEVDYFKLLDEVLEHNLHRQRKTFFFAICHSLQVLSRHFDIAEVVDAPRPVYGIMPAYPTPAGQQSFLLEDLGERFFAFERRNYQVVHPDQSALDKIGAHVTAIESRHGLRGKAIMGLSIGNEFQCTQFHPEADRDSILKNFLDPEKCADILKLNGEELYNKMIASLRSEDRVKRTRDIMIPKFLYRAYNHLVEVEERETVLC
jgi:anthranilate/para-aminobenzoate synthase component II